jgi:DNA-binding NtrC family response regulator
VTVEKPPTSAQTIAEALDRVVDEAARDARASFAALVKAAGLDPARDFVGACLRDLDFRGEDLRGFDFSGADLTGADFRGAKLAGVRFDGAILTGAIGLRAGELGTSEAMRQVEMLLRRVADIDSSLLITGESGVGKEVAAKFVHQISTRAAEPFVAVNCGVIPNELIESQLFGHEKGAFTSAQARHHGYVERARNGILFLDEVGALPMLMQAKLLRLIQERTFTRVGGETAIKTSARIICATNTDLEAAVSAGGFRRDLYYRINVIAVGIPPLRDRSDDILPLAQRFVHEFSAAFVRDVHGFTPAAEQALLNHPWPDNVRELRNRVERAVALSQTPQIGVEALFPPEAPELGTARPLFPTLAEVRDRAERDHIRDQRNIGATAATTIVPGPNFGPKRPGSRRN